MNKKKDSKEKLRAFRIELNLDRKLEKRSQELRVSCSWLIREYVRQGLLTDEEVGNGDVRKVRVLRT